MSEPNKETEPDLHELVTPTGYKGFYGNGMMVSSIPILAATSASEVNLRITFLYNLICGMDFNFLSGLLFARTSGFPYLESRNWYLLASLCRWELS